MIAILFAALAIAGQRDLQADYDECMRVGLRPSICADQREHDEKEYAMYGQLKSDEYAIGDIWRPSPQLLSDMRAARRCYIQFHLYKVDNCTEEFDRVDHDLLKNPSK